MFYHATKNAPRTVNEHGLTGYGQKCRCGICVDARREYNKAYNKRYREEIRAGTRTPKRKVTPSKPRAARHGTLYSYQAKACRCSECRAVKSAYDKAQWAKKRNA